MFIITTVIVVICFLLIWRQSERSAIKIVIYTWLAQLVLIAVPIIRFNVDYSLRADIVVSACIGLMFVAYITTRRRGGASSRHVYHAISGRKELRFSQYALSVYSVIGIFGNLMLLFDMQGKSPLSLNAGTFLLDLGEHRSRVLDSIGEQGVSRTAVVGSYLSAFSFLSIVGAAYPASFYEHVRDRDRRLITVMKWLAIINILMLSAVGFIVYGGRAQLIYALGVGVSALYLRNVRVLIPSVRRVTLITLIAVGIAFLSSSWLVAREGRHVNIDKILEVTQRAEVHPLVKDIVAGSPYLGMAAVSIGYFSSPLPSLAFYLEQDNVPGPKFGKYSYPILWNTLSKVCGECDSESWMEVRNQVFAPFEGAGYFGNVWATWIRDLVVDFGVVGASIYCLICGALLAYIRNSFDRSPSLETHQIEAIGTFAIAFGAFQNVLWYPPIAMAFFIAVTVHVMRRLIRAAK